MKGIPDDAYAIAVFFSDFQILRVYVACGYSFGLPRLVEAIQMSTHNICFYKEIQGQ